MTAKEERQFALSIEVAAMLNDGWFVDYTRTFLAGSLHKVGCNYYLRVTDLEHENVGYADRDKIQVVAVVKEELRIARHKLDIYLPSTKVKKSRGMDALVSAIRTKIFPDANAKIIQIEAKAEVEATCEAVTKASLAELAETIAKLGTNAKLEPDFYIDSVLNAYGIDGTSKVSVYGKDVTFSLSNVALGKAKRILAILAE